MFRFELFFTLIQAFSSRIDTAFLDDIFFLVHTHNYTVILPNCITRERHFKYSVSVVPCLHGNKKDLHWDAADSRQEKHWLRTTWRRSGRRGYPTRSHRCSA